jgi:hypothetical protein
MRMYRMRTDLADLTRRDNLLVTYSLPEAAAWLRTARHRPG